VPWDIVEGSIRGLSAPSAVAVDRTYFEELGIKGVGDRAEINGNSVTITTVTDGIRSFTTLPYVFTPSSWRARCSARHPTCRPTPS
jgi:putative ABC transport system permease protein